MIHERNHTTIKAGDVWTFRGLDGQDVHFIKVTVVRISSDGSLLVEQYDHETNQKIMLPVPLERALALIEERIWWKFGQ